MPQTPPLDGLPLWAQVVVTVIIGLGMIGIAFKGYLTKDRPSITADSPSTARVLGAMIADMGAVRNLADCVLRLDTTIQTLIKSVDEATHHERNNVEVGREMCARLRELHEELERQGRSVAERYRFEDKRDAQR